MELLLKYEKQLHGDLCAYLLSHNEIDKIFPQCVDVEEKWETIATSYMPDGMREYQQYPGLVLGWMMYVGMAMAQYWHEDWEIYGKMPEPYLYMRQKRGFDNLDDYIREDVLLLRGDDFNNTERLVGNTANRAYHLLTHSAIEPGTPLAFRCFVATLRQMYLMGMAVQLHRLGYAMQKLS